MTASGSHAPSFSETQQSFYDENCAVSACTVESIIRDTMKFGGSFASCLQLLNALATEGRTTATGAIWTHAAVQSGVRLWRSHGRLSASAGPQISVSGTPRIHGDPSSPPTPVIRGARVDGVDSSMLATPILRVTDRFLCTSTDKQDAPHTPRLWINAGKRSHARSTDSAPCLKRLIPTSPIEVTPVLHHSARSTSVVREAATVMTRSPVLGATSLPMAENDRSSDEASPDKLAADLAPGAEPAQIFETAKAEFVSQNLRLQAARLAVDAMKAHAHDAQRSGTNTEACTRGRLKEAIGTLAIRQEQQVASAFKLRYAELRFRESDAAKHGAGLVVSQGR